MTSKEDRRAKKLTHLNEMQRRIDARIDAQHQRVSQRFDRARGRLGSDGEPSDTQQRIIDAALKVLDQEGLNSLSLRKLAALIDKRAPALYWHFKNKEILIDYMAEAILQAEFKNLEPRRSDEPWQDWLVAICKRLRRAMKSHRDGARIVAGAHPYPAVTLIKLFEVTQESLISAGVDERQADLMVTTAVHFTFGRVIEEQSSPSMEELEAHDMHTLFAEYPHMAASAQRTIDDLKNGYDGYEDSLRLIVGYPNQTTRRAPSGQ